MVKLLLASGANVNAKDNDGFTALTRATQHNNIKMIKQLLAYKAEPNLLTADGGWSVLHFTVVHGKEAGNDSYQAAQLLLKSGAPIDHANFGGENTVAIAARFQKNRTLDVLLANSANVELLIKHNGVR